jgi:hypothetical protein
LGFEIWDLGFGIWDLGFGILKISILALSLVSFSEAVFGLFSKPYICRL